MFLLLLTCNSLLLSAQIDLDWERNTELEEGLPPSIKIFETFGTYDDGAPLHAIYAEVDLTDPNIILSSAYSAGDEGFKTPGEFAAEEVEPDYVTINAGYFSSTSSVSLVIEDGQLRVPGIASVSGLFPMRGAFGVDPAGNPDVTWTYNVGEEQTTYRYPRPNPDNTIPPTATYPQGGEPWAVNAAVGAGPVLVENGIARVFSTEELAQQNTTDTKEPRTAIGYTEDNRAILMVVDGRQVGLSSGISLLDLADVLVALDCVEGLNLDGGGSSAMVVADELANSPSDAGNVQRNVPSVFMVKRRPQVYDTDFAENYSEVGEGWSETGNAGFYGSSRSRLVETGDGSKKAVYAFGGLPPAQYEVSGWWVTADNRSTETPFSIVRAGFENDTVRIDQTTGADRFNPIGTFHLSGDDQIVVSNDAPGNYIITDAIKLTKVGESFPAINYAGEAVRDLVQGDTLQLPLRLSSPNTGVTLESLRIFKTDIDGNEAPFGDAIDLGRVLNITYPFEYGLTDGLGTISFRYELTDNLGRVVSEGLTVNLKVFEIVLNPSKENISVEANTEYALSVSADTDNEDQLLSGLTIYKTVNDGGEEVLESDIPLQGMAYEYDFSYLVTERPTDRVQLRFEVTTEQGAQVDKLLNLNVVPERGDFRVAVISDFNASFGSTEYEFQVDSIVQRIPRLWSPDLVIAGGDMVAGQSTALSNEQLRAMWDAFDEKIATPFRDTATPFIFTVGNHDASKSETFAREQGIMAEYWGEPQTAPKWFPVNMDNYPFYYSAMDKEDGDIFIVSWDASASYFSEEELEFVREQFTSPEAEAAKVKLLVGHLPLYGVAQERDTPGNVLDNPEELQAMMEELGVHTYISGHHHAYYPGKHGDVDLLNAGLIGSGPRKLLNSDEVSPRTTTLMDFFFERDSVVYTTYEITEELAGDMELFDDQELQPIISGINGYIIRRDIELQGQAMAGLSSLNILDDAAVETGTASISVNLEESTAIFNGRFSNLRGTLLETRDAVAIYTGQHTEDGELIGVLNVESEDGRSGSISGSIEVSPEFKELLSAGAVHALLKTTDSPEGAMRSQVYVEANSAPAKAEISAPSAEDTIAVRDVLAILPITWQKAEDPDQNPVTYTYQLSLYKDFVQLLVNKKTGRSLEYRAMTEGDLYAFLYGAEEGEVVTFYQRVIATDGRNSSVSLATELKLAKSDAPVEGSVEVPAPDYEFDGLFGQAPASNGNGLAVDGNGRVWVVAFSRGIKVLDPDGSSYPLTSDALAYADGDTAGYVDNITFKGTTTTTSGMRGVGIAADGNILVIIQNSDIVKLDRITGEPLAYWDGPVSLTDPTSDDSGRVFVASVVGDRQFLLKLNGSDPTTYDVVLGGEDADGDGSPDGFSLPGRALARSSFISPEGDRIYVPANSGSDVHVYTSENGTDFELSETLDSGSTSGSNSVFAGDDGVFWHIANRGTEPPKLNFRDFPNKLSYTLLLEDVPSFDLRGLSFTESRDTLYMVGSDNGQVIRYRKVAGGAPVTDFLTYSVDEVNGVDDAGVADFDGEYARVLGTVNSLNLSGTGLDFSMEANGEGIGVYNPASLLGCNAKKNDSLAVVGRIVQEYGQLRITADSVRVLTASRPITGPREVTEFINANESVNNTVQGVQFDDVSQWGNMASYTGFSVWASGSEGVYEIFVDRQSPLFNAPAPDEGVLYDVNGILRQFRPRPPFADEGFALYVQEMDDIKPSEGLGIGDRADKDIIAYPNPVRDRLNLRLKAKMVRAIEIHSLTGQLVKSFEGEELKSLELSLDVSGLRSGMYLLKIFSFEDGARVIKLIKE